MRQAGLLAAGALYALQHHVERLADDHANAQLLSQRLTHAPGFVCEASRVETNIVLFQPPGGDAFRDLDPGDVAARARRIREQALDITELSDKARALDRTLGFVRRSD